MAGITISSLTGEKGLISKVKQASEKSKEAENYQNEIINSYEKEIEKYIDGERYIIGSYEILGYNQETEKLKLTITITSNKPIENIVYPEGDKLICDGKTEVGIDYEVVDGEEYVFIVGNKEKQEKYLIQTKGYTKNDKSYIENAQDLVELRTIVNIGFSLENKTLELVNDINLEKVCYEVDGTVANDKSWIKIGNEMANAFKGTFNGNYHKINNIYINETTDNNGLFGFVEGGTIQNVLVSGFVHGKQSNGLLTADVLGNSTVYRCASISGNVISETYGPAGLIRSC